MSQTSKNDLILRPKKRVAVLVDFSRSVGRKILLGIAKFLRENHEWSVQSGEWRWTDNVPAWFRRWKGDGAIVWAETCEQAAVFRDMKIPMVDVRGSVPGCHLPKVDSENRLASAMAAEHLMERGFRHFAFCGFVGANYSDQRSAAFQRHLAQMGFGCSIYRPLEVSRDPQTIELEKRGLLFQEHLEKWLLALPKPVGLMACNDIRGQQVMNACRRLNLIVPESVAVIGVDNDEIFCELSDPPLSSISLDAVRIGYEAAKLLGNLMAGVQPPVKPLLIAPLNVVTRRSTDVLSMDDPQLAAGARFLREHVFDPIGVNDIAAVAGLSRRVFERRFVEQVGRPPKAEILRLRLERVKELLLNTDMPLVRIAERTGFKRPEYLHSVFTRKNKVTPGKFREQSKYNTRQKAYF